MDKPKIRLFFSSVVNNALWRLDQSGMDHRAETWQGVSTGERPDMITREVLNYEFIYDMPGTKDELQSEVKPDLPWAEDHFLERVSGWPINPGKAYKDWPYHGADPDRFLDEDGVFDISYMERIWAGRIPHMVGIRKPIGDMGNILEMLASEPSTRKATLPLFFPEDTGAEGRTMCSLHYHFMIRHNRLHLWYALRSCDFVRHFANDVYMAIRMAQFVRRSLSRPELTLGNLYFTAYSFHYHHGDSHLIPVMMEKYNGPS